MRLFLTILTACLILETAHAANFPYIRLNAKTNRLSDSGTAVTYNGTALVLSTESGVTNALGRAISGTGPLAATSVTDLLAPIASPTFTGAVAITNSSISQRPLQVNALTGTTNDLFNVTMDSTNYVRVGKFGDTNVSIMFNPSGFHGAVGVGSLDGIAGIKTWSLDANIDWLAAHNSFAGYNAQSAGTNVYPYLMGFNSRGTLASPLNSANGDILNEFGGSGYASGGYRNAVLLRAFVNGSPSGTNVPGALQVSCWNGTTPVQNVIATFQAGVNPLFMEGSSAGQYSYIKNTLNTGTASWRAINDGSAYAEVGKGGSGRSDLLTSAGFVLSSTTGVVIGSFGNANDTVIFVAGGVAASSEIGRVSSTILASKGTVNGTNGFAVGSVAGITTTWTNMIPGVITQRISSVGGIIVTNLTL